MVGNLDIRHNIHHWDGGHTRHRELYKSLGWWAHSASGTLDITGMVGTLDIRHNRHHWDGGREYISRMLAKDVSMMLVTESS
jgi:hypothetical protein